ncbi:MAG: hypothetical protein JOZ02_05425 [Acidobacteria bacterium]|nr:hypothetical protein [Acidobacteriota bacterium]
MESLGQVAVKSKEQGDAADYRVLARSEGPLTAADFETCFEELNVGEIKGLSPGAQPPDEAAAGGRAPWMTVGPFNADGRQYVAVIRQNWTSRHDMRGRPAAAQFCLCLPYDVLAAQGPSYASLNANFPPQQFFLREPKGPLDAPEISSGSLAEGAQEILRQIDEFGFDFCAFVASMILASPVAIVGGNALSVEARLSFFDSVASLLPYGLHAELGVSTWINSNSVGKIHLAFTDYVLPNQKRVVWREAAPKELEPNQLACEYHKLLHRLWGDPQADRGQIIGDLALKRTPYTFGDGRGVVNALREVNWEKIVYEDVKGKRGKKEEVRELLRARRGQRLSSDQQNDLLLFLLAQRPLELEDVELLRERWDESLWVPTCELVSKELQYPVFQEEILWALCSVAAEKKWLEKFLEALLKPNALKSLTPTLKLFYQAINEFDYDQARVRYLIRRDPRLFYALLFMVGGEHETHPELEELLSWQWSDEEMPAAEIAGFDIALGRRDEDAGPEMLESLAARDASYVEKLFRIAATRFHLTKDYSAIRHLTPAVSQWLLGRLGRLEPREADVWKEHVRLMRAGPSDAMDLAARLDVLSLTARDGADTLLIERLLGEGPESRVKQYGEEFARILSLPGLDPQGIIRRLFDHLNRLQLDAAGASNDLGLIAKLLPAVRWEHIRNQLVTHLSRTISKHPALLTHDAFEREIRGRLLDWGKGERLLNILYGAFETAAHTGGPVAQVVGLYAQLSELNMPQLEERAAGVLSGSNYLDDLKKIDCFVEAVQQSLEGVTATPEEAWDRMRALQQKLFRIKSKPMSQYLDRHIDQLYEALENMDELLGLTADYLDEERAEEIRQILARMRESVPASRLLGFSRGRKRNDRPN